MSGPDVQLSLPPASWFTFPPTDSPLTLPPPAPEYDEFTWKSPVAVSPHFYNKALQWDIPLKFAVCYIIVVTTWNSINTKRGLKPYGISKSSLFKLFVLVHNLVLAVYSLVTCIAMIRAVAVSWPGWLGEGGLPGAVDALCKINGPRGLGDAVTYNSSTSTWSSKNLKILLGEDQLTPDSTDVGRIWNEGLAFWGWLFYLSKYYEVVDNVIILLKGKRASTLQVYHHAGALICMWAGIRYMSPPIWMFVLVNSGIHALMYAYYTLCTVGIRPSKAVKQTITTLQITQFIVGFSFAAAHLFVSYSVPVSIPYTVRSILSGLPSAAAITSNVKSAFNSAFSSATMPSMSDVTSVASEAKSYASSVSSFLSGGSSSWSSFAAKATNSGASAAESLAAKATNSGASFASSVGARATDSAVSLAHQATDEASIFAVHASATMSALASKALADDAMWLKKLLYRAAGREALAEAVRNHDGQLFGPEFDEGLIPRTVEEIKEEVLYRHEFQNVRCLDTHGQAFAIWLNVGYLLPLTTLFIKFFRRAYQGKQRTLSGSPKIASRNTGRAVDKFGRETEGKVDQFREEAVEGAEELHLGEKYEYAKKEVIKTAKAVQKKVQQFDAEETFERVKTETVETYERVRGEAGEVYERVKEEASEKLEGFVEGATHIKNSLVDAMSGDDDNAGAALAKQESQHDESDEVEEPGDDDDGDDVHRPDVSVEALQQSPDRGFGIFTPGEVDSSGVMVPSSLSSSSMTTATGTGMATSTGMKTEGPDEDKKAVLIDNKPGQSAGKLTMSHSSSIPVKKPGGSGSGSGNGSGSSGGGNGGNGGSGGNGGASGLSSSASSAASVGGNGGGSSHKSPKKKGHKASGSHGGGGHGHGH